MQALRKKLRSSKGTSILFALMLFLVCATVAAIILGSASTNLQKSKERKAQLQTYASVSSAARLLRDAVKDLSYIGVEHQETYGCTGMGLTLSDPDEHDTIYSFDQFERANDNTDFLSELLLEGAQKVYMSQLQYAVDKRIPFTGWSETFTIDDGLCPVSVIVSIDSDYALTFLLSPADENRKEDYHMTVICKSSVSDPTQTFEDLTCTHTWTHWTEDGIQVDEPDTSFTGQKTFYTTTIAWETGSIFKGVSRRE